jgi:SAM-dependent methyltransferase
MERTSESGHAMAEPLPAEWRSYFLQLLHEPRFPAGRRFLRRDIGETMRRLVPKDARVLEVGVGAGHVLAGLPNEVRWGIDVLPEAVAATRSLDSRLHVEQKDVRDMALPERFDAIICDRLIHTFPDVQALLDNLVAHLTDEGRIYLTCFNFLWSLPLEVGAKLGIHELSPPGNWFSESDLDNLFALCGLESVHYEDRILVPADFAGEGILNRVMAKLQPFKSFSFYRTYVLRRVQVARPKNATVSVIVPARNEAGNILAAAERTPLMGPKTELIYVEGGSSDDTWARIQEVVRTYRGPLTLRAAQQRGKGKADAVRQGFEMATGDILMILDADLTTQPEDLPKFYDIMIRGLADYVHGTRLVYPMEDQAMRFLNKLGNAFFAKMFTFLLDQPIKDTLCGTKVLWKHDYDRIVANNHYVGECDPFGDFDIIFAVAELGLKIMEIPVRYKSRVYGETNMPRFQHGAHLLKMSLLAAKRIKFT